MEEKVIDKLVLKTLEKFRDRLDEFIAQDPEKEAPETEASPEEEEEPDKNRRESAIGAGTVSILGEITAARCQSYQAQSFPILHILVRFFTFHLVKMRVKNLPFI
jgi:hypothetical protein